jgi:MFS family permease
VGHIRAFAAFAALAAATAVGYALLPSLLAWAALRFVSGLAIAGLFVVVESWLNGASDERTRGSVLAVYMVLLYATVGASQLLLDFPDPHGGARFALSGVLIGLAVIPVALTKAAAPELGEAEPLALAELARGAPLGVAGGLVSGLVVSTLYSLSPLFARESGLDDGEIGRFMATLMFGGLLLQWPLGRLSDRFDRRVVLGLTAFAAAGAALVLLAASGPLGLGLAAALLGGFCFTLYPLALANAFDRLRPSQMLPASSTMLRVYAAGSVVGPVASSALMQGLGAPGFPAWIAAACAGLGLLGLRRAALVRRVPEPERASFLAVPHTSPEILALDPRPEEMGGEVEQEARVP